MTISRNKLTYQAGCRIRVGFTLVELLVVVSIIALLISILLPSLKKAREQARSVVGLSNLKSMSTGVMTYASEYGGTLPGPLHPAIYRDQTQGGYQRTLPGYSAAAIRYSRNRQLTWILHTVMSQKGEPYDDNVADKVATCPTMLGIVPDKHFKDWNAMNPNRGVFPTHYVLNNYGSLTADDNDPGTFDVETRITRPNYYFGFSAPLGKEVALRKEVKNNPPQSTSRIRRASDEWMIADAWYRVKNNSGPVPDQEGPYQSGWSGEALPHRSEEHTSELQSH